VCWLNVSSRITRRLLVLLAVPCLAGLVAFGCASPTLPLPPPSRPTVAGPDDTGTVSLTGGVPSRAQAFAMNTRTSVIAGQQTGESGRYALRLEAEVGDEVEFWYQAGTSDSASVYLVIQPPRETPGEGGAGGSDGE
jgi:hypothetical protein